MEDCLVTALWSRPPDPWAQNPPGHHIKCGFQFRRSGVGPGVCVSNKLPGYVAAAGAGPTL